MAPEVDPPRPATVIATTASNNTQGQSSGSSDPHLSATRSEQPVASTHGFGYLGQKVQLPQRRKRATFQVGSPGLSEDEAEGSLGSNASRGGSESPDFDVRASFAPMPVYGKNRIATQASSYRGVGDQNSAAFVTRSETDAAQAAMDSSSSDDEAGGLSFGGRRWKGKTVHAVEQELEALRDERLMSHAPDAAYLASRLEGVRRNLEIEERRPTYVPYDEDMLIDDDESEAGLPQDASDIVRQLYPFQHVGDNVNDAAGPLAHRPVSNASSVSLVEGETPHDLEFGSSASSAFDQIKVHDPNEVSLPPVTAFTSKPIDPAARAAALDARIEVRPLRRGDLEQVRDLHAFHGDSDRVSSHFAALALSSGSYPSPPLETSTTQGSPRAITGVTDCCGQSVWRSACRCSPTQPAQQPLFRGFATGMT